MGSLSWPFGRLRALRRVGPRLALRIEANCRLYLLSVCLTVLMPAFARGQASSHIVLRGLTRVAVTVTFDPEVRRWGLDNASFQEQVEARLRTAGLTVLSGPAASRPTIEVRSWLRLRGDPQQLAYYIQLIVREHATLFRSEALAVVQTYQVAHLGVTTEIDRVRDEFRSQIDSLLDIFINDLLRERGK